MHGQQNIKIYSKIVLTRLYLSRCVNVFPFLLLSSWSWRKGRGERFWTKFSNTLLGGSTWRQTATPAPLGTNCYIVRKLLLSLLRNRELEQHYSEQTVGSETKIHGLVPGCNKRRFPFPLFRKHWNPPRPHFSGGWSFPLGENSRDVKLTFHLHLLVAVRLWMNAAAPNSLTCFYRVNREKFVVWY
jgi:hypothetical protein